MKKISQFIIFGIILVGFLYLQFTNFDIGVTTEVKVDNSFLENNEDFQFNVTYINDVDSISIYNSNDDFLFVHQIDGFKNIDIDSVRIEKIDYFERIDFSPYRSIDWGNGIGIKSITSSLSSKGELIITTPNKFITDADSNKKSIQLMSKGFAILDHNHNPLIKYSLPEKRKLNLVFNMENSNMKIAVIIRKTDTEIDIAKQIDSLKPAKHKKEPHDKDTLMVESNSIIFFKPTNEEYSEYVRKYGADLEFYESDSDFEVYANNLIARFKDTDTKVKIANERFFVFRNHSKNKDTIIDKFKNGTSQYGVIIKQENKKPFVNYGVMTDVDIISKYNE